MNDNEVKLPEYMEFIKKVVDEMSIFVMYENDEPDKLAKIAFKLLSLADDKNKKEMKEVSEYIQKLYEEKSNLLLRYAEKYKQVNDWYDTVLYREKYVQEREIERQAKAKLAEAEVKK